MKKWQNDLKKQFSRKALKVVTNKAEYDDFMQKYDDTKTYVRNNNGFFSSVFSMVGDIFTFKYKPSIISILSFVFFIIYFLLPTDFLLDIIPILGYVDDAILFSISTGYIVNEYRKYCTFKNVIEYNEAENINDTQN